MANAKAYQIVDAFYHGKTGRVHVFMRGIDGTLLSGVAQGFQPYVYMHVPVTGTLATADAREAFRRRLNGQLQAQNNLHKNATPVVGIDAPDESTWTLMWGYRPAPLRVCRVRLNRQSDIQALRKLCSTGVMTLGGPPRSYMLVETWVDPVVRCFSDLNVGGASWVHVAETVTMGTSMLNIRPVPADNVAVLNSVAPLRRMVIHVVRGPKGVVACIASCADGRAPLVHTWAAPVGDDASTVHCGNEARMLVRWAAFLREFDPDVLVAHQLMSVDLAAIMGRVTALGIANEFGVLGRIAGILPGGGRTTVSESNQKGARVAVAVSIPGRILLDLSTVIKDNFNLKSFELSSLARTLLKRTYPTFTLACVDQMMREDPAALAAHARTGAQLTLAIMEHLQVMVQLVETARATGVTVTQVQRGQMFKLSSMLLSYAHRLRFLLPNIHEDNLALFMNVCTTPSEPRGKRKRDDDSSDDACNSDDVSDDGGTRGGGGRVPGYKGAIVLDPICGFHHDSAILVLDFASLYPSIIMAHNLCASTALLDPNVQVDPEHVFVTPTGHRFVRQSLRRGVSSTVLATLLDLRKQARAAMAGCEPGSVAHMVLNKRQLALKVVANSVYGISGAPKAFIRCVWVASSVTAIGRANIQRTSEFVTERGYTVVYGDTDSVMVRANAVPEPPPSAAEWFRIGETLATDATAAINAPPMKLEMEAVFFNMMMVCKKMYMAMKLSKPTARADAELLVKGFVTARSNVCAFVRDVLLDVIRTLVCPDHGHAVDTAALLASVQACVRAHLQRLLANEVPLDALICSNRMSRAKYSEKSKQAHTMVAAKVAARGKVNAPVVGDRVQYVFTSGHGGTVDLAEDPLHAIDTNLPINYDHYISLLREPLYAIVNTVSAGSGPSLFGGSFLQSIPRVVATPSRSLLNFTVRPRCGGCGAPGSALCGRCAGNSAAVVADIEDLVRGLETRLSALDATCAQCQGTTHARRCVCTDCPTVYERHCLTTRMDKHKATLQVL